MRGLYDYENLFVDYGSVLLVCLAIIGSCVVWRCLLKPIIFVDVFYSPLHSVQRQQLCACLLAAISDYGPSAVCLCLLRLLLVVGVFYRPLHSAQCQLLCACLLAVLGDCRVSVVCLCLMDSIFWCTDYAGWAMSSTSSTPMTSKTCDDVEWS